MNINIYIAHSDDPAYSIPIFISKLIHQTHNLKIIHVFQRTDYAPNLESKEIPVVTRIRSKEIKDFCKANGVSLMFMDYKDACLRADYIGKEACTGLALTSTDKRLLRNLLRTISRVDLIMFPLAIGNHVDHIILKEAGITYAKTKYPVAFYEDLPYAYEFSEENIDSHVDSVARKIGSRLEKELISDSNFVNLKKSAALLNKSQVSDRYVYEIIEYSKRRYQLDGGHERIWYLKN